MAGHCNVATLRGLHFMTIRDSVMCADSTAARTLLGLKMCALTRIGRSLAM